MSKALVVSDIHINDYAQRNPTNRFRLYQGSRTVASNIIEVGRAEGCDYIIFAGDIIEKSVIRPYVQAEVKYFLDTIMANFKAGWIIWGNHDLDGRSTEQDISDACLGVMLPGNLYYAHKRTVNIDGHTFGFCNWMPEFDLSWIPSKVDILFTHATICYSTDSENTLYESQVLDENKFDLAICGDIHRTGTIGKYVSIGVPQRCKMGDSDESTGVVVDFSSLQWKWVNLNPHDNLMKFEYTADLDKEGWCAENHTWYVYKQDNTSLIGNKENIKVAAWEEIGALINESIIKAGLQGVHGEVLKNIKNIDAGEVDFNFTMLWFHCKNWRSIDECTMNFKDGDRILIQGANGSGKSSLLSAIKYAFVDVGDTSGLTSLKPFIQIGSKECLTEVEFLYQGNVCKISRGTKDYGLWINGEPQKYSDKRSFEADVRSRFPFIKYMDAFFFDADHHQFIGGMSPERKTEIVSKFLKLDRIDTYNETARLLSEQFRKEFTLWTGKVKEVEKLVDYIEGRLAEIVVPTMPKSQLEELKREGLELQRKNDEWNRFVNRSAVLQAQIKDYELKGEELGKEISDFRSVAIIDYEITAINTEINKYQSRLIELGNISKDLEYKKREFAMLRDEGNKAWKEAKELELGKTCSLCGQEIKTTAAMEKHRQELLGRVDEIRPKIESLKSEIANLENTWSTASEESKNIQDSIQALTTEVSSRMTEKRHQETVIKEASRYRELLKSAKDSLVALGNVEKVELPDNFLEKMSELEKGIISWTLWETNEADLKEKREELKKYQAEVDRIGGCLQDIDRYINLTGLTGVIYEEILNKLKTEFSDNTVKYIIERKGKGAREHLSLTPQFNNNGNYIDYFGCSSGQRTLLDLNFLSKIISKLGILTFDEFLKHLDQQNFESCIEIISNLNVSCIFLSSHMESIPAFNNKSCQLSLNESGTTVIDFK